MLLLQRYHNYLLLEKSLSANSVLAYEQDLKRLMDFLEKRSMEAEAATVDDLQEFVYYLGKETTSTKTQARIISGVKSFYNFLLYTDVITHDPTELIEMPRIGQYLPTVLSLDEINDLIGAIDLSKPEGQRNKAIIEMLYGSGLRVSELVNLKLSNMNFEESYMIIEGKGRKQRLVPISTEAEKQFELWKIDRNKLKIEKPNADYAFLNRYGRPLTRAMIFTIIKQLAQLAGIHKNISPHTLRHSFATHLHQNGANLRIVQQLLGHESITTTEIYTHVNVQHLRNEIMKYHPMNRKRVSDEL